MKQYVDVILRLNIQKYFLSSDWLSTTSYENPFDASLYEYYRKHSKFSLILL
jgi:hypothetical protein